MTYYDNTIIVPWNKPLDKDVSKMEGHFEDNLDEWLGCLVDFSKVLHNCLNSGEFTIDFM